MFKFSLWEKNLINNLSDFCSTIPWKLTRIAAWGIKRIGEKDVCQTLIIYQRLSNYLIHLMQTTQRRTTISMYTDD